MPARAMHAAAPGWSRQAGRGTNMANVIAASRHACFALALLACSMAAGARADDVPQPPQQPPAATPPGQKSGEGGVRATPPNSPAAAEQHRLPPDSTTKQTLALPGRTLD